MSSQSASETASLAASEISNAPNVSRLQRHVRHMLGRSSTEHTHTLFPSLPDGEELMSDFSCAWFKDILVQGRLYITERHVCFYANIFGWEETLILPFSKVTKIRKSYTALVIPNAIVIETKDSNYTFSSFLARDQAYRCLTAVHANAMLSSPLGPDALRKLFTDSWKAIDAKTEKRGRKKSKASSKSRLQHASAADDHRKRSGRSESHSMGSSSESSTASKQISSAPMPIASSQGKDADTGGGTDGLQVGSWASQLEVPLNDEDASSEPEVRTRALTVDNSELEQAGSGREACRAGQSTDTLTDDQAVAAATVQRAVNESPDADSADETVRVAQELREKMFSLGRAVSEEDLSESIVSTASYSSRQTIHYPISAPAEAKELKTYFCDLTLDCSVDTLYENLFTRSAVMDEVYARQETTDVSESDWAENHETGLKERHLSYRLKLSFRIGPSTTVAEEVQREVVPARPGQYYVVDTEVATPAVPYGDKFYTLSRYCLTAVSPTKSRLLVTAETRYYQPPWVVVRKFVEKHSTEGLSKYWTLVASTLQHYIQTCDKQPEIDVEEVEGLEQICSEEDLLKRQSSTLVRYVPSTGSMKRVHTTSRTVETHVKGRPAAATAAAESTEERLVQPTAGLGAWTSKDIINVGLQLLLLAVLLLIAHRMALLEQQLSKLASQRFDAA